MTFGFQMHMSCEYEENIMCCVAQLPNNAYCQFTVDGKRKKAQLQN